MRIRPATKSSLTITYRTHHNPMETAKNTEKQTHSTKLCLILPREIFKAELSGRGSTTPALFPLESFPYLASADKISPATLAAFSFSHSPASLHSSTSNPAKKNRKTHQIRTNNIINKQKFKEFS